MTFTGANTLYELKHATHHRVHSLNLMSKNTNIGLLTSSAGFFDLRHQIIIERTCTHLQEKYAGSSIPNSSVRGAERQVFESNSN